MQIELKRIEITLWLETERCALCDGYGQAKYEIIHCWRCGGSGTVFTDKKIRHPLLKAKKL